MVVFVCGDGVCKFIVCVSRVGGGGRVEHVSVSS